MATGIPKAAGSADCSADDTAADGRWRDTGSAATSCCDDVASVESWWGSWPTSAWCIAAWCASWGWWCAMSTPVSDVQTSLMLFRRYQNNQNMIGQRVSYGIVGMWARLVDP